MSTPPEPRATGGQLTQVLAAVIFLASLAAIVVLVVMEKPTDVVLLFVSPVVAALYISGHVSNVTERQNQTIARIDHQTNGSLDARIETRVLAALAKAGIIKALPPAPLDPSDPPR